MNDNPDPRTSGDGELADALGDALRDAPDDLVIPPPVADIAERAAAKARARNARRTVGSIAASVMLVAGGVVVWNAANDGEPGEDIAVASTDDGAQEAVESEPAEESATSQLVEGAAPPISDVDPEDYTTGPVLQWTEIAGPADRGGNLMTLPDGRVMVRVWSDSGTADQVLITSDGTTWEPVSLPAGVSPNFVDFGDDLWVVTGWNDAAVEFGDTVHISSDQGASWDELSVPGVDESSDAYVMTRSYIGGAAVLGDQVVVALSSFTDIDVAQIAIDQGIATSPDEVRGWGTESGEDGVTTITIDIGDPFRFEDEDAEGEDPFAVETFEFDAAELGLPADPDLLFGPASDSFTVLAGDASGLRDVAEFAGNPARLVAADGVLALSAFGETGALMWTSTDTTTWTAVDVGDGFEFAGVFRGDLWGGGWSPDGFIVQRLGDGVFEDVATFPGLSLNSLISVGPAGLGATVAVDGFFVGDGRIPMDELPADEVGILPAGVMAAADGIELRIEDDGTGTLIDTGSGEILREFSEDEMNQDEPPVGVIEVDDGTDFSLRIEDPVTGEELVTFTAEDYAQGFDPPIDDAGSEGFTVEAGSSSGFVEGPALEGEEFFAPENWVAWSANGADWSFQRVAEAFDLPPDQDAWAQVAVGDGYVVAAVETFSTDEGPVTESSAVRWFLATTN